MKVTAWYDNEWGFSNRMLDTACAMMAASSLNVPPTLAAFPAIVSNSNVVV